MKQRWLQLVLGSLLVLIGAWPAAHTAAQTAPPDLQLTIQPAFGGNYRTGAWLPVHVAVANNGADVNATITVNVGATYAATVELPRGANKQLTIYALPTGTFRRTLTARVLVDGQERAKAEAPLTGIGATAQVIGTLAEAAITMPLPANRPNQRVQALPLTLSDLPDRREGLSIFDVLILDGAPINDLGPAQWTALADWVRTGGQLIIGGSQLDGTINRLPEELRIATVGAPTTSPISILPEIAAAAPAALTLTPIDNARSIATAGPTTVAVQREIGSGRVTLIGWSLAAAELGQLAPETGAWSVLLRPRPAAPNMNMGPFPGANQDSQISFALMQLPVLAMPPLGVLIGLLVAYMLIVGPGLYLVLRRLDRQAWGWVAVPVITILFSLGTYGYGLAIRGDDIILNQVSVIEPVDGHTRVRSYGGIFSPRTDRYAVSSTGDALFKPIIGDPNWGPAPASTTDGQFLQGSGGVRDFAVNQWSLSAFGAEQMIDGSPLEGRFEMADGVLRGSLHNTGSATIHDVAVFQNMRVKRVGDLAPGQTQDVELKLATVVNMWGGSITYELLKDKWNFNQPKQPPADVRMQQSLLDAMFSNPDTMPTQPMAIGWLDNAPISFTVDRDRVQHQQMTLLTMPLAVEYGTGQRVSLPRGWMRPTYETSALAGGSCYSQFGPGWYLDNGDLIGTFQLPLNAQPLAIDKASFQIRSDGPRPNVALELFDWQTAQWTAHELKGDALDVPDPARFFSANGQFKAKLQIKAGMQGSGCLISDLSVEGARS